MPYGDLSTEALGIGGGQGRHAIYGARRWSSRSLGLSETVLVFPAHRAFVGELPLFEAVEQERLMGPARRIELSMMTWRRSPPPSAMRTA